MAIVSADIPITTGIDQTSDDRTAPAGVLADVDGYAVDRDGRLELAHSEINEQNF